MQVINKTFEKVVALASDDGRFKVSVDYESFGSAQDAVSSAHKQVEEYERSARAVILNELEARGVLKRWKLLSADIPADLSAEEAKEYRAKMSQDEKYSLGQITDTIFDDDRGESTYYIFAPASDADVRDLCVLMSMCGVGLMDSLNVHKYCFCCRQAQLKKGSKYLVQLGAGSDFPEFCEWARVVDMDVLAEGVKALAKFVKDFK